MNFNWKCLNCKFYFMVPTLYTTCTSFSLCSEDFLLLTYYYENVGQKCQMSNCQNAKLKSKVIHNSLITLIIWVSYVRDVTHVSHYYYYYYYVLLSLLLLLLLQQQHIFFSLLKIFVTWHFLIPFLYFALDSSFFSLTWNVKGKLHGGQFYLWKKGKNRTISN